MKDAASSITLEEVIRKHKVPSTHASSNRYAVDRNITLGKVEGSIEVYYFEFHLSFWIINSMI